MISLKCPSRIHKVNKLTIYILEERLIQSNNMMIEINEWRKDCSAKKVCYYSKIKSFEC
jgi:hypothetical protein